MLRSRAAGCLAVPLLVGVLAGCQSTPVDPAAPSFPLPTYSVGDRFTFDNDQTDRVVAVDGDWVGWKRGNGFQWTGHRDFMAPVRDWVSKMTIGKLESVTELHGAIWPVRSGRSIWFSYTSQTVGKDGTAKATYGYRWHCGVKKTERVTVPAGTFETAPISCHRYSGNSGTYFGERIWYYAPRVGHYVRYVDRSMTRGTRTRKLKSFRLKLPKLARAQSTLYNTNLQTALQTLRSGAIRKFEGAGLRASITPVRTFKDTTGRYCREYSRIILLEGREYGACRTKAGFWQRFRRTKHL